MATDPAEVERLFLACLAREPEFWLAVQVTEDDIHPSNTWGRGFLKSGLELIKEGHQPKLVNIVRHGQQYGIPEISFFQELAAEAIEDIRLDFLDIQDQVLLESKRRRMLYELTKAHEDVATCSVFDLRKKNDEIQTKLAKIDLSTDEDRKHDLGSVIEDASDENVDIPAPMPTRWRRFNRIVGGGLHAATIWAIGGAPGARKTTWAIYNMALDWADDGYRLMHVAVDGGDIFQQGIRYLTVMWEKEIDRQRIQRPSRGMFTLPVEIAGERREYPYIRPGVVRQILRPKTYGQMKLNIPPDIMDCFFAARERMKAFKTSNDGGWIRMFDANDIQDADMMGKQLRLNHQLFGIDAFLVDHAGEVDAPGRTESEKRAYVTAEITRFVNRYGSRAVILAQRTQSANYGDDKDTNNPGLAYQQKLHQASTLVGITHYDSDLPYDMKLTFPKNREDEAGGNVSLPFKIIPSSGYITEA